MRAQIELPENTTDFLIGNARARPMERACASQSPALDGRAS